MREILIRDWELLQLQQKLQVEIIIPNSLLNRLLVLRDSYCLFASIILFLWRTYLIKDPVYLKFLEYNLKSFVRLPHSWSFTYK